MKDDSVKMIGMALSCFIFNYIFINNNSQYILFLEDAAENCNKEILFLL